MTVRLDPLRDLAVHLTIVGAVVAVVGGLAASRPGETEAHPFMGTADPGHSRTCSMCRYGSHLDQDPPPAFTNLYTSAPAVR